MEVDFNNQNTPNHQRSFSFLYPMNFHTFFCLIFLTLGLSRVVAAPVLATTPATQVEDLSATLNATLNVNSVGTWLVSFEINDHNFTGGTQEVFPDNNQSTVEGSVAGNYHIKYI
jgi:hypothetical protein